MGQLRRRYQAGGWTALKKRKRGVCEGTSRKLTAEQEDEVRQLITDKMPDQLKLQFHETRSLQYNLVNTENLPLILIKLHKRKQFIEPGSTK